MFKFGIFLDVFAIFSLIILRLLMDSMYQLICYYSQNLETTSLKKKKSDECTPVASKRQFIYC